MNPTANIPSNDKDRSRRKGFARGLFALLVMGVSLAVWPRLGIPARTPEHSLDGSRPSERTPRPASVSTTISPMSTRVLSPATAVEMGELERLKVVFMAALALGTQMEQDAALDRCLIGMTPEMAATLLASLKSEDLKSGAAQQLFDHWATAKPRDAIAWVQQQDDPEISQSFLTVAAMRWAVVDLSQAASWARSLPKGDARAEIMAAVGSEAVRSDPLESLLLGFELPQGTAQTDLIRRAMAEWAITDRESAVRWTKQIEDNDLRLRVTEQVAVASADQDPVAASTIALQQMAPGEEQNRALVSIIQRWVQSDPEFVSAWVSGFPKGALGRDAMDSLVTLWANRDLVASGDWLLTLPAGELRNVGIRAYSRALARTDAELAQLWASSVTSAQ